MRLNKQLAGMLAALALSCTALPAASGATQVLATVGSLQVTADDLNRALASSPFADKMPAMDENNQAGLRGDMLRRLVISRLLTLEAERLGVDKAEAYRKEMADFRLSLLYRAYMDKLRQGITIPTDTLAAMKAQFKNDRDGLEAAKAAFINEQYQTQKRQATQNLIKQEKIKLHEERIGPTIKPDTVLAEGSRIRVTYADVAEDGAKAPKVEAVRERLLRRLELLAAANAAQAQGLDVSTAMKKYAGERLPATLMEAKTREWIPNEKALKEWYDKHPDASMVPEKRHVGHIVVAGENEAQALRARIAKGESLFTLAGQYSLDPVGRAKKGDIGWIVQGRGVPELDQALSRLKDGETSGVVKTADGHFHLVTILERVKAKKEEYGKMRERIAQLVINEKLPPYVAELEQRHRVTWNVVAKAAPQAASQAAAK